MFLQLDAVKQNVEEEIDCPTTAMVLVLGSGRCSLGHLHVPCAVFCLLCILSTLHLQLPTHVLPSSVFSL